MTQYIFQDEATICLVSAVREYFGTNVLCRDWQWSPDKDGRRIDIVDAWGEEERSYPQIIINAIVGGSEEHLGFGDALEKIKDGSNDIGQYFGSSVSMDINFQAASFNRRETHRISDLLMIGLMKEIPEKVAKDTLANLLLEPPYIRIGGEGQRSLADETVEHTRTISQRWRSFWKSEIIYDEEILAYLTTAERTKLNGSTMNVQFKAD